MHRAHVLLVVLAASVTACENTTPTSKVPDPTPTSAVDTASPSATPATVPDSTTAGGPGATFCDDMGGLIEAARKNFPDMRKKDKPLPSKVEPGFESTVVLANTVGCRILTSEAPYPDAYQCDLAKVGSRAEAKAVLDRWAPLVGACPQLAKWKATTPNEFGRRWELETGDNHQLEVQLITTGDDNTRPTLVIRLNEI